MIYRFVQMVKITNGIMLLFSKADSGQATFISLAANAKAGSKLC